MSVWARLRAWIVREIVEGHTGPCLDCRDGNHLACDGCACCPPRVTSWAS